MYIYQANGLSAGSVSDMLEAWYNAHRLTDDSKSRFYCGIARDPEERISDHEREDHDGKVIQLAVAYECDNMEIAGEVETLMRQKQFDIGGACREANGAAEDSKYVYLYRKP